MSRAVDDTTREMLEGALFQFQFMALMSQAGRTDDADAAYVKGMARLSAVLAEPEPEPEPEPKPNPGVMWLKAEHDDPEFEPGEYRWRAEHPGQVTDPAANDEESDSARWRAERRYQNAAERDELDLY